MEKTLGRMIYIALDKVIKEIVTSKKENTVDSILEYLYKCRDTFEKDMKR